MKWWKEKNEKDKEEMITKFEQLSSDDFGEWLLNQSKWKNDLNNENIFAIDFAIQTYIDYHSIDDVLFVFFIVKRKLFKSHSFFFKKKNRKKINSKNKEIGMTKNKDINWNETEQKEKAEIIENFRIVSKGGELTAYVIVNERKISIKMKELTFEELLHQIHTYLKLEHFQMDNNFLKIQLIDMKNNIVKSDEAVRKEFERAEPSFGLRWNPILIEKIKPIKNALVVMITISEYCDNEIWCNLPNVQKDADNLRQLFEQELKYEFVHNKEFKMNKEDVAEFLEDVTIKHELAKNKRKYDALTIIILGHGDKRDALITSEGAYFPIDCIRSLFNCSKMESLRNCPKIFIINTCHGNTVPQFSDLIQAKGYATKQSNVHCGYDFLTIQSITKGYQTINLSLFNEDIEHTIISKYKICYPLTQMLNQNIMKRSDNEWYCVQSKHYDIVFQQRNTSLELIDYFLCSSVRVSNKKNKIKQTISSELQKKKRRDNHKTT
ncbi:hypothetical protein RFI_17076 [Reticulomyxa filosa]|uniref:Caspase family p20 domain-containing protein n=1 Tax=Reticulomyxa filosa TaxID=46433 RepID=X6N2L3_RETFI|nr:hypothetical protein RFI_17076 [Reticulomyxa filosa]|eukprot:ETO20143.1 hypothetical protein RFI_17076 [Reticulomyxa filosa]